MTNDPSRDELVQAATGEGYDPDQTWQDEPDDDGGDLVDDAGDHNDGEPEREV